MLKRFIPNVLNPAFWQNLLREGQIAWQLLRDPRVPRRTKAVPIIILVYLLSPIDLIPAWIPVLGQLDDLAMLLLGVKLFLRLAPQEVVAEYQRVVPQPKT